MKINDVSFELGREYSVERSDWSSTQFDTSILADIKSVQHHSNYEAAKKGSYEDSFKLSLAFYKKEYLAKCYEKFNQPIIVPVMAEEKQGKNAIPLGMADVLQGHLGWDLTKDIIQTNKAGHTKANGWYRITSHATFAGKVVVGGEYYIVDDFIGMGGTITALKSFIELAGGIVVGSEALTGKPESTKLYLRTDTLTHLREQHEQIESEFKALVGFGFEKLTEAEGQYLLRAKSIERIRNQIVKALSIRDGG